jgi:hypothetical protein
MIYTREAWLEKRRRGLFRYLLIDGVLLMGGPFAVVLQVAGYFVFADEGQTFGQYFASPSTWARFFAHGLLFGIIMGYISWWRNQRASAASMS